VGRRCVGFLGYVGLVGLGAIACGPSFQAVYECDVRFEHCYALDQRPVSTDAQKECWRDWLHGYTYGQSRDRVEYAATRFSELSLDPTLPSEERDLPKRVRPGAAPVPTNAFAPPPSTAEHADASAAPPTGPSAHPVVAGSHAPGAECAEGCSGYWAACHQTCNDGACEACDKAYKLCVPGCFQKK
jgi:hypothetical protein